MPARSEAQRRYLYAKFGSAWVHRHHFANKGRLPAHVTPKHPGDALMRARKLRQSAKR